MPAIAHNFSTDAGNVSALRTAYPAFVVEQAGHNGPLLLLCEHASAHVPSIYDGLGLSDDERHRHIGWDIGALALAQGLASALASPLVYATQSRLLMDLNRDPAASDAMPACSDQLQIPGNVAVSNIERVRRQQWLYEPFHEAVDALRASRSGRGLATAVVSVHSFTPQMSGHVRPWHVGILSDQDRRLADALLDVLRSQPNLCVGDNLPYAPQQGVYHSVDRHGQKHGLLNVMIEVRNDLLGDDAGIRHWTQILSDAIRVACSQLGMT